MKVTVYVDELRGELRRRGVPGGDAEQIVAEVRSHVAETGEEPVSAFGPAGVYAEAYAAPSVRGRVDRSTPLWARILAGVVAALVVPAGLASWAGLLFTAFTLNPSSTGSAVLGVVAVAYALPVIAHRRRAAGAAWWVSLAAGIVALGALGTVVAFVLPLSLGSAESTTSCTVQGQCTTTDLSRGIAGMGVADALLLLAAVVYVVVCLVAMRPRKGVSR